MGRAKHHRLHLEKTRLIYWLIPTVKHGGGDVMGRLARTEGRKNVAKHPDLERPLLFLLHNHYARVCDPRSPACVCVHASASACVCLHVCLHVFQDCFVCVGDGRSMDPTDDCDDVRPFSG